MENMKKVEKNTFTFDRGVKCFGLSSSDSHWHYCEIGERVVALV